MPARSILASLEPSLALFAAAVALDFLSVEFPNAVHPVAWMGQTISWLERLLPKRSGALRQLAAGSLLVLAVPGAFAGASMLLGSSGRRWPLITFAASALLLKSTFALGALGRAGVAVRDDLARGRLAEARHGLRSLCGREATNLPEPLLVAATVESLAENASDSFVAPLFYYLLLGLPGAVFYRAVNTLDAMIGYHGRYEYLGKASALLDDLLNLIPARLTAGFLLLAGWCCRQDARRGWRILRRDGAKPESPNAGCPMAAMAGLLQVELEKKGHYRLGDPLQALEISRIDEAWRLVTVCCYMAAGLVAAALGVRHAYAG
ncbi:MAG: adenosylcobinamide-phosphate synthase CbiB [Pseudomonadota bacterium]